MAAHSATACGSTTPAHCQTYCSTTHSAGLTPFGRRRPFGEEEGQRKARAPAWTSAGTSPGTSGSMGGARKTMRTTRAGQRSPPENTLWGSTARWDAPFAFWNTCLPTVPSRAACRRGLDFLLIIMR